jgi:hypothetical protein
VHQLRREGPRRPVREREFWDARGREGVHGDGE